MYTESILDFFPISENMPSARNGQKAVLKEIDKVFRSGKKLIILEGPVGCGKSAIAMTLARAFQSANVITPLKSLQNQYFSDISDDIVLMKGRSSYPCTFNSTPSKYKNVIRQISTGQIQPPSKSEVSCGAGPCKNSMEMYKRCKDLVGMCPYTFAMETAQEHSCVVHNVHSFMFQTMFGDKFEKRPLLIIDEAHDLEKIIREFIIKKISVSKPIPVNERPDNIQDVDAWCDFLLQDRFVPALNAGEAAYKAGNPDWVSPRDEYISRIENFRESKDYYGDKFCVKVNVNHVGNVAVSTTLEFIPDNLGNSAERLFLSKGDYVLLMSGTIFDKNVYCRNLGIDPDSAHFIRVPSEMPKDARPVYVKEQYQVDTSHANWDDNFPEIISKMTKIMGIFHDAKGLIHAPSYSAAQQIYNSLPPERVMTHDSQNFQQKLQEFYDSDLPLVFISPVCQQGVDFKNDRARFQIITRVPYMNTSDEFINYKVTNDFSWYNYQALVTFGQQLGRINRAPGDYGATFLMDSRFNRFITKNARVIPAWQKEAFIWR